MDDSMADSVFDVAGDSSDFEPVIIQPKLKGITKKPVVSKIAKPKAAPKAKAGPKKRAKLESDTENSDVESGLDDDDLLSNTPPKKSKKPAPIKKSSGKPLQEINNESFDMRDDYDDEPAPKTNSKKGNSDKYQKLSHVEHILIRPDTYIGSVERTDQEMWVFNSETTAIEYRKVVYVPGLYKIFDEILVNAADNKQNDKTMDEIKVTVERDTGVISVQNNGKGIPIEIHNKEGIYIPELIFGHLLTSTNYDDKQEKVTGGRNGYGAKLCNVFSTEFTIETADSKHKKKYKQTWTENMSKKGKAKITDFSGKDYTKVTFHPDYSKFNMDGMDDDFEALVKRRIYDMAGTLKKVKVSLNGERIKIKNFEDYMRMYTKAIQAEQGADGTAEIQKEVIITDNPHERWEIGFAVSDGSFKQVSFVNSIATTFGGSHVKYVSDQIVNKLLDEFKKKNKKAVALKNHQIQNHIFLFVNCQITNPAFTSQTKEQLTTKATQFGSKFTISDAFLKKVLKTDVMTNIMHFAEKKADQLLAKSDGSKRARMNNAKLTDANKAGTKDGWQCTLILTEGDSASGLALAGRAVLDPDRIGVFPLRGKLLNVRDASVAQISNNQEIQNIKKFMGLQHKKEYTDTKSLRYGHLMIMTDQDHDGSHIKGLLINLFEAQFPSLLKLDNFLNVFITPIVKVWKGDQKNPNKSKLFYTMPEYDEWRGIPGNEKWDHKYYKGLGTSDTADAELYFKDLDRHLKEFEPIKQEEAALIDLAFSKKKADARKNWLRDFVPGTYMDMAPKRITYNDFINKELILFSMADNLRSIPSVLDGLKPSQRKVLFTCFRLNIKKDMKVVQLAGIVSGTTGYAYGDASLQQTIIALAQDFVGSNNINCLEPSGNFGSRRLGGADAASPRYTYTRLTPFARKLFHPADDALLEGQVDEGKSIEPVNYVPILPMLLLNGADGIGTGWSTSIPNYRPEDIIENLKLRMASDSKESMLPMKPWFRGFKGAVDQLENDRWKFSGIVNQTADNEVEITELPVRYWTQDFKDKLEDIIKAEKTPSFIKDYAEYNTPTDVHFVIKLDDKNMKDVLHTGLEEKFKLTKTMATSNLVAFDSQGRIHKYESVLDILEEFYHVRLKYYEKRKQHLLNELQKDLDRLSNQSRFIKMIIDGTLVVSKKKKDALVAELRKLNFKPFPKASDAKKAGELQEIVEGADLGDESEDVLDGDAKDFEYLLGMAIWSLTQERVDKLLRQIGDKEVEVDELIMLTPKDLWNRDLDDFLAEWHFQLGDEKQRKKKRAAVGRRGSAKLGLTGKAAKRKRKGADSDGSDDDFAVQKKKPAGKKQPSILTSYFSAPSASQNTVSQSQATTGAGVDDDDFMDIDDDEPKLIPIKQRSKLTVAKTAAVSKASKPAPKAATKPAPKEELKAELSDLDDVMNAIAKQAPSRKASEPPARQARGAAKRAKYVLSSDSEEGDDQLGDVSMMVRGIGSGENSGSGGRPFFSNTTNRPSSSHGLPRSLSTKKSIVDLVGEDSTGIDETDYKSLIPQGSPIRPAPRRAGETKPFDDDDMDEDSFDMPPPKPKILTKKPAATKASLAKPKAAAAKPKAPERPKIMALSPAAKAYAAKQAKANAALVSKAPAKTLASKKNAISDDESDIAADILSDVSDVSDDEPIVPVARPGRRAAVVAAKTKKFVIESDDEDEEEPSEEEEDSFTVDDDSF